MDREREGRCGEGKGEGGRDDQDAPLIPICCPGEIVTLPNARPSSAVALGENPGGVCAAIAAEEAKIEASRESECILRFAT